MGFTMSAAPNKIQPTGYWPTADIYFTAPQHLDRPGQVQARGQVDFDGGWLHILLNGAEKIISVPANVVQRVEWSQDAEAPNLH